jgi:hypothetical protein
VTFFFRFSSVVTSKPQIFWWNVASTGFFIFWNHIVRSSSSLIKSSRSVSFEELHNMLIFADIKLINLWELHFELFVSLLLSHFFNFLHNDSLPFGGKFMQFANVTSLFSYTMDIDYLIDLYRCLLWHLKFCLTAWGIAFSS